MNFNPEMMGMDGDSDFGGEGSPNQRMQAAATMGDDRQRNSEGWIIVGGNFRKLVIYSIRNGTMEDKPLAGHTDSVTCMTISGNLLFTGSDDCTIRLWNLQSKYTPAEPLGRHDEAIQDLTCLNNGLLISCAYDGKIICWHVRDDRVYDEVHKEN